MFVDASSVEPIESENNASFDSQLTFDSMEQSVSDGTSTMLRIMH